MKAVAHSLNDSQMKLPDSLNIQYFTCGRSCVRCLSLSVCFRPRRSSSAFLFWMIDRRSWTWKTNRISGGVSEIFQCPSFSVCLSVGCKLALEIPPPRLHLSLTLSSCLSLSLCCLCSTFLCMSTRLRIVLSLSIAETGSLARSRSISMASLSAGLQSAFTTGDGKLEVYKKCT